MQMPLQFYKSEKELFQQQLSSIKKKLAVFSTLRLFVFLGTGFGIYFIFGNTQLTILVAIIGISAFLYLVSKYSDLQENRDLCKKLIDINETEIKVLNNDYLALDEGKEFIDPSHFYSYDIDLFGRGSFFQYCNRTVTNEGKKELANILTNNDISAIERKQEGNRELSKSPKWRQRFSAIASLGKLQHSAKEIVSWIHNYKSVFPQFLSYLPVVFSIITLLLIALASFQFVNSQVLIVWFLLDLVFPGCILKG